MKALSLHTPTLAASLAVACSLQITAGISQAAVETTPFGKMPDGQKVELYTLTNQKGVTVAVATFGATVVKMITPDRNGSPADIALGFDRLEPYLSKTYVTENPFMGSTIGRYANRIANGRFTLDGNSYQATVNNGPNSLHGGTKGFDKCVWAAEVLSSSDEPSVRFTLHSPDGDQGFPGAVDASVTYTLNRRNELRMDFRAVTDKKTIVNLTNHTYFNLAGEGNGTILDHLLTIPADHYNPVDDTLIPTGEIRSVAGTPLDFRKPTAIGARIKEAGNKPTGYDYNFVLGKMLFPRLRLTAEMYEPASGRVVRMLSDQPGVQFYSGNSLNGKFKGKSGKPYVQYSGIVLEPQFYPDSPNKPNFPSVVLNPGETYRARIVLQFATR